MSKTTNRSSPEVRARAVRMVLDHEKEHRSRWAAASSIATKIGCRKPKWAIEAFKESIALALFRGFPA